MAQSRKYVCDTMKSDIRYEKWNMTVNKILAGEHLIPEKDNPFYLMEDDVISVLQCRMEKLGVNDTRSNMKRLNKIITFFPETDFNNILESLDKALTKTSAFANTFTVAGDKFHEASEFENALLCYNLGVSYAPSGSQILSEIYAKRATLFVKTRKPFLALTDIETALSFPDISRILASNLERQKQNCWNLLKMRTVPDNFKHAAYTEDLIFKIDGENNPRMPSADACIQMRFTKKKGRHLITTQELGPGITVIVEEPYVTRSNNSVLWELEHCFTCYTKISRTVPCHKCVFAIYCSEECRKQDYEGGHKFLCQCAPYIHTVSPEVYLHLALKAICRAGPEYMFKFYQDSSSNAPEAQDRNSKLIPGFDPKTGIYSSDSHYQVMNFINHGQNDKELVNRLAFLAVSSAKVLAAKSTFFKRIPDEEKQKFIHFISFVILQHSLTFPRYGFEILRRPRNHQLEHDSKHAQLWKSRNGDGGITGIYSLCSMINHACEPNVMGHHSKRGRLAIVTKQKLRPGDELLLSYGEDYMTFDYQHRLAWSTKYYKFKCECIACSFDWPTLANTPPQQPFLCPRCVSRTYPRAFINEFCWLKEEEGLLECKYCRRKFKMTPFVKKRMRYQALLKKSEELISSKNPLDALPLVLECISYFQARSQSPCKDLILAQDFLEAIYDGIIVL